MNTKTIISDLGKEVIRVHGDLFDKREQHFLLHYEDIGTRVLSSKDTLLEKRYLDARQNMNRIVSYCLLEVIDTELGRPLVRSHKFLVTVNQFKENLWILFSQMKDHNLL